MNGFKLWNEMTNFDADHWGCCCAWELLQSDYSWASYEWGDWRCVRLAEAVFGSQVSVLHFLFLGIIHRTNFLCQKHLSCLCLPIKKEMAWRIVHKISDRIYNWICDFSILNRTSSVNFGIHHWTRVGSVPFFLLQIPLRYIFLEAIPPPVYVKKGIGLK